MCKGVNFDVNQGGDKDGCGGGNDYFAYENAEKDGGPTNSPCEED